MAVLMRPSECAHCRLTRRRIAKGEQPLFYDWGARASESTTLNCFWKYVKADIAGGAATGLQSVRTGKGQGNIVGQPRVFTSRGCPLQNFPPNWKNNSEVFPEFISHEHQHRRLRDNEVFLLFEFHFNPLLSKKDGIITLSCLQRDIPHRIFWR